MPTFTDPVYAYGTIWAYASGFGLYAVPADGLSNLSTVRVQGGASNHVIDIQVDPANSFGGILFWNFNTAPVSPVSIRTVDAAPLTLGTANIERIRIDGLSGNVGIGSAPNPVGVLDVAPPASQGGRVVTTAMADNPADIGFKMYRFTGAYTPPPNPPVPLFNPFYIRMNGADLQFMSGVQAPINGESMTARMAITQAGNVCIGLTAPTNSANKLEVLGNIVATSGDVFSSGRVLAGGVITSNGNTSLPLGANGTPYMWVTTAGTVGIGAVTTQGKLDLVGGDLFVRTADWQASGVGSALSVSLPGWTGSVDSRIQAYKGGIPTKGDVVLNEAGGSVRVGSIAANPTYRLLVGGDVFAGNITSTGGVGAQYVSAGANGVATTGPIKALGTNASLIFQSPDGGERMRIAAPAGGVSTVTITGVLHTTNGITSDNAAISTTGNANIEVGGTGQFKAGGTVIADHNGCYYA